MEPEGSLFCLKELVIGPYRKTDESMQHTCYFIKIHFSVNKPSVPTFSTCLFPSDFKTKFVNFLVFTPSLSSHLR